MRGFAVGGAGRGFLYVISRLGVTGRAGRLAADVDALVARVRARPLPSRWASASRSPTGRRGLPWADAAVVGSALVNVIAEHAASADVRSAPASTCDG